MRKIAGLLLALSAAPAFADHPGADRLDALMAGKEAAFRATDLRDTPDPELVTADGRVLRLSEMADQVVVLSFAPADCGPACAAQQKALEAVTQNIDAAPMREMVTFVVVAQQGLAGEAEGPNRLHVTPASEPVAALADAFAGLTARGEGLPRVHVIDRGGRHAAVFEGAAFDPLNMTLYINGLTNSPPPAEPRIFDRLRDLLW